MGTILLAREGREMKRKLGKSEVLLFQKFNNVLYNRSLIKLKRKGKNVHCGVQKGVSTRESNRLN